MLMLKNSGSKQSKKKNRLWKFISDDLPQNHKSHSLDQNSYTNILMLLVFQIWY